MTQHQRRRHIQPGLGLVEDHDCRVVQQRRGDDDLLPHPLRVRTNALIGRDAEIEEAKEAVDLVGEQAFGQFAQASDELQVFTAGQERIEVRLFRDVADRAMEGDHVGADIQAVVLDEAARGLEQASEHSRGGGLAGSVGPEIAHHFAGFDRQVDVVDDTNAGKAFR